MRPESTTFLAHAAPRTRTPRGSIGAQEGLRYALAGEEAGVRGRR